MISIFKIQVMISAMWLFDFVSIVGLHVIYVPTWVLFVLYLGSVLEIPILLRAYEVVRRHF